MIKKTPIRPATSLDASILFIIELENIPKAQRQALPASAGIGGQSHQMPNPPMGPRF